MRWSCGLVVVGAAAGDEDKGGVGVNAGAGDPDGDLFCLILSSGGVRGEKWRGETAGAVASSPLISGLNAGDLRIDGAGDGGVYRCLRYAPPPSYISSPVSSLSPSACSFAGVAAVRSSRVSSFFSNGTSSAIRSVTSAAVLAFAVWVSVDSEKSSSPSESTLEVSLEWEAIVDNSGGGGGGSNGTDSDGVACARARGDAEVYIVDPWI